MSNDLAELTAGKIRFNPHPGQWKAWNSQKRFILILAGTQGGKTSFGPHWLYREIQKAGPGDYLVVTPTFQLLEKKALPEFKKLFEQWLKLGRYVSSPSRKFTFSKAGDLRTFGAHDPDKPTVVWFGYADDPESLESATAKAAWLDECGQKRFKLASWEAILRRLSLAQGRALLTTTPYDLGWLKQKIWDAWRQAKDQGDEALAKCLYDVIRFDSTENPMFPREEFDRAKADLPAWKFDLFYRAIFTRPAGMIYDNFKDEPVPHGHKCPRFKIDPSWKRYLGLDFGGVNTAGTFYAEDPKSRKVKPEAVDKRPDQLEDGDYVPLSGTFYLYRTYLQGGRTAGEHAKALLEGEPGIPVCVGGSQSEGQWRQEFRAGGLPVMEPPIKDVEVGIDRVYGAHAAGQIIVFDDLAKYLEQKLTYSRELDDQGEPTEKIEDKAKFHLMDAERYIWAHLRRQQRGRKTESWRGRTGGYAG